MLHNQILMGITPDFLLKHIRPYGLEALAMVCRTDGELAHWLVEQGVSAGQVRTAFTAWAATSELAVNSDTLPQFVRSAEIISQARWEELYPTGKSTIMFFEGAHLAELSQESEQNKGQAFDFVPNIPIPIAVTIQKSGPAMVHQNVYGVRVTTTGEGHAVHFDRLIPTAPTLSEAPLAMTTSTNHFTPNTMQNNLQELRHYRDIVAQIAELVLAARKPVQTQQESGFHSGMTAYAERVFQSASNHQALQEIASDYGLESPASLLAADKPSSNDLNSLLNSVGKAPGSTSVVTVPSTPTNNDVSLIQNVQTLESYIAVLTALVMYNKHPAMYNLSDPAEATQFVVDTANAKNYVMTGGTVKDIAMYLPGMEASTQTKSISTTSASFHVDFLKVLFEGLSMPETVLTQMDSILTEITDTLKNLKLSFKSQSETLNHVVSYYYLSPVAGTNPPINEMKVRFIYLQIKQKSWEVAVGKSSVEHFSFDMVLTQTNSTMSSGLVSANTSRIMNALEALTAKDPTEISKMTGAKGVKTGGGGSNSSLGEGIQVSSEGLGSGLDVGDDVGGDSGGDAGGDAGDGSGADSGNAGGDDSGVNVGEQG